VNEEALAVLIRAAAALNLAEKSGKKRIGK
jgi:hypothetical protein